MLKEKVYIKKYALSLKTTDFPFNRVVSWVPRMWGI